MSCKKKTYHLGNESKIDIIDGPPNTDLVQCFIDKKIHEYEFSIKFSIFRDKLKFKISDVVIERRLEGVYLFTAESEQIPGRLRGFYNAISKKGTLSKDYNEGHN